MIRAVRVRPAPRRLARPLATGAGPVSALLGAAVEVETDAGCAAGEAPLLPGVDSAAQDAVVAALEGAARDWPGRPLSFAVGWLASASLPAAAGWALDTALASALARERGVSRAALWCEEGSPLSFVRTNALLDADAPEEIDAQARRLSEAGEHTLKLTVAARSAALDLERVAAARSGAAAGVAIRLDANAAWTEAEARDRLRGFAAYQPEYVEQPTRADDPEALARLRAWSEAEESD